MKTLNAMLISVGLVSLTAQAYSSNVRVSEPPLNSLYSSHNYKHPDLAAKAAHWENEPSIWVNRMGSASHVQTYKNQMSADQPIGSVSVIDPNHAEQVNWNYKTPHHKDLYTPLPGNHLRKHTMTIGH